MAIRVSNVTAQILYRPSEINRSVIDTLNFIQESEKRQITVSNFTFQILQSETGIFGTISNTLEIVDQANNFLAIDDRKVAEDELQFAQNAKAFGYETVEQEIEFVQQIGVIGPIIKNITHNLALHQDTSNCIGLSWEPYEIEDELDIDHWAGVGHPLSVSDTLSFIDEVFQANPLTHVINFSQSISIGKSINISDILSLSDSLDSNNLFNVSITHADFIKHAFTYYIDNKCTRKQYNRFQGEGERDGIPSVPLTFDAFFVLESLSGTKETLEIRSPESDDRQRIGFSRINRETRGGELNVFSDSSWPKIHSLLFTITALSDGCLEKINSLLNFFQNHLGEEILIHDWEGISWRGIITTPNEIATEDQDGWWTISFEFQGSIVDGSFNDQRMNITDQVIFGGEWGRSSSSELELIDAVVSSILGTIARSLEHDLGISDSVSGMLEHPILEDDFSGGASSLHGESPDVGDSTWSAHSNYKANGTQTAINSGAYYPFVPENNKIYHIEWEPRSLSESDGLETLFFLGEGLNSDPDEIGPDAYGAIDPTTLKAGFVLRKIGSSQLNACRLGDDSDGQADTVDFSDATLKAESDDIDLRLILDNWKATWYAKDPASSSWTEVRSESNLLSNDITMVGWSNNNITTTVTMNEIKITQKTEI